MDWADGGYVGFVNRKYPLAVVRFGVGDAQLQTKEEQ